ncbi:unnamed protein product [Euphydryas editha]|uniref:Uncharacterized protein n=1 Tax=Euphydryas editha TaxID=104508 RepID=A0AAU9TAE0_EUPED|nr:unnamed protein product [Euphydryas editha]
MSTSRRHFVKIAYTDYFKVQVCNLDKPWVPKTVCQNCVISLRQWSSVPKKFPEVHSPHDLARTKHHHDDCYFCVVNINDINSNNRSKWIYPDLPSAKRPTLVPILAQEPIPPVLLSTSTAASCQMETDNIIDDDKSKDPDSS